MTDEYKDWRWWYARVRRKIMFCVCAFAGHDWQPVIGLQMAERCDRCRNIRVQGRVWR